MRSISAQSGDDNTANVQTRFLQYDGSFTTAQGSGALTIHDRATTTPR
jgi:hypothetical protein